MRQRGCADHHSAVHVDLSAGDGERSAEEEDREKRRWSTRKRSLGAHLARVLIPARLLALLGGGGKSADDAEGIGHTGLGSRVSGDGDESPRRGRVVRAGVSLHDFALPSGTAELRRELGMYAALITCFALFYLCYGDNGDGSGSTNLAWAKGRVFGLDMMAGGEGGGRDEAWVGVGLKPESAQLSPEESTRRRAQGSSSRLRGKHNGGEIELNPSRRPGVAGAITGEEPGDGVDDAADATSVDSTSHSNKYVTPRGSSAPMAASGIKVTGLGASGVGAHHHHGSVVTSTAVKGPSRVHGVSTAAASRVSYASWMTPAQKSEQRAQARAAERKRERELARRAGVRSGTPESQLWLRQIVDELGDLDVEKAAEAFLAIPTAQEASILEYMTLAKEDEMMISGLLASVDDERIMQLLNASSDAAAANAVLNALDPERRPVIRGKVKAADLLIFKKPASPPPTITSPPPLPVVIAGNGDRGASWDGGDGGNDGIDIASGGEEENEGGEVLEDDEAAWGGGRLVGEGRDKNMRMKGNSVRLGTGQTSLGSGTAREARTHGGTGGSANGASMVTVEVPGGGSKVVVGLAVDASPGADLNTWVKLALMDLEARSPEEAAAVFAPLPFMHQKLILAQEKSTRKSAEYLGKCERRRAARLLVLMPARRAARCVMEMPQGAATDVLGELEATHPKFAQQVEAAINGH